MTTEPVHEHEGKWWFWDETWTDRIGPFETQELATAVCRDYVLFLDTGSVTELLRTQWTTK